MTASAFVNHYFTRPLENQFSSYWVRDDLLQVSKGDFPVNCDDGPGMLVREHLPVVAVGPPSLSKGSQAGDGMVDGQVNVRVSPAGIDISVQSTEIEQSP